MGLVIRVALMFFFIQFLVVMSIMTVALLLARREISTLGVSPGWMLSGQIKQSQFTGRVAFSVPCFAWFALCACAVSTRTGQGSGSAGNRIS